jgi:hypothetical protein
MIENGFTKPPGAVGNLILFQIEMDQTVFFIAEREYGLFRAWFYLALWFVLFCSHQITIEISAAKKQNIFAKKKSLRCKFVFLRSL